TLLRRHAGISPFPTRRSSDRCESPDTRRVHCPMDTSRGVVLVRQLSQNACIRDTDSGVDTLGVWVARGCRAEFRARPGADVATRSEEHTSELQSRENLVCRLL